MRRIIAILVGMPAGYLTFAFVGYWTIVSLSSNAFDRSLEAAMTAAFVTGPAGAIIGLIGGFLMGGKKQASN